jgi:cytoplasmic iron level regulating protein YaaA (DUF328/UPF0246 family)
MITILSPAKKLDKKTDRTIGQTSAPDFIEDSRQLIGELRQLSPEQISSLMNVNRKIAELNYERFARWQPPFNRDNASPAVFLFNGQAYLGLEAETLNDDDLYFAQDHLRILSGLYGLLRPLDLVQPYRLEMGTRLSNPRGKDLYEFWGEKLTQAINEALSKHESKVLMNLASNEYFKAIKPQVLEGDIITPVFKEKKGNQYKTIAVYAKTARGLMTRYIIENRIEDPEAIKGFDQQGYIYSPEMSDEKEWVFIR